MNIIPQLSDFLKYGLMGFGAIILILAYFLLRNEQSKPSTNPSTLKGIYIFMGLGIILALIGLVAPSMNKSEQTQSSKVELKNSKNNIGKVKQSGGSKNQTSDLTLTDSDSNDIQVNQGDTIKVRK